MSTRRDRALYVILFIALIAIFLVRAWPTLPSVVDDAWISARYARNLALGNGPVYNAGEPPVEGYTNLSFVVLLAIAYKLGIHLHSAMVGLGLLFGACAVVGMQPLTEGLIGKKSWWTFVPAAWLAFDPHLAVVSTNGIESSMFLAAVIWGCALALRTGSRIGPAILVAVLITTRPEGIAVAATITVYEAVFYRSKAWPVVVSTTATAIGVWVGRFLYFGHWVPNTFAAKDSRDLMAQIQFNLKYLSPDALFWAVVALILLVGLGLKKERALVAAIALGLTAVAFKVDMWMPGGRLLLPAASLALALGGSRLDELFEASRSKLASAAWAPSAVASALFLGILVAGPVPKHVFKYDGKHTALPGNGAQLAMEHLAPYLPKGSVLATRDAGVLAYFIGPDVKVAELHQRALTQPHPESKDADISAFTPQNPEVFISTLREPKQAKMEYPNDRKVWKGLTAEYVYLGRVNQHYRRYYDVYVRADLKVPPLPKELVVSFAGPKPKDK